jgi:glycerate 2-kinase
MIIPPEKFATRSLLSSPWRNAICQVLADAIHSADAGICIKNKLKLDAEKLNINNMSFDLEAYRFIYIIGAGKAAVPMTQAVVEMLGGRITSGVVISKDGYSGNDSTLPLDQIEVLQAGHPIPDQNSLFASSKLVNLAQKLSSKDLVLCLISGGGSSLMVHPSPGLTLNDIKETTSLLLSCGAAIDEINTVRKHLDILKGGGLAKILFPATVISLILSDVIGDSLDMVASGPTVADRTTYTDARLILKKYKIWNRIPSPIRGHIIDGIEGVSPETVKPGNPVLDNVHNILVGNNTQSALAAVQAANDFGFSAELLPITLQGEASLVGQAITERVKTTLAPYISTFHPACFIAGGETTVTVKGNGKGGRNQELALSAVKNLSGVREMTLVSLATDGIDGQTDAAGAVATNQTYTLGLANGLDPVEYLLRNDSYNYFNLLGDLIKTGPTLTNVNDLLFIFVS